MATSSRWQTQRVLVVPACALSSVRDQVNHAATNKPETGLFIAYPGTPAVATT